MSYENAVQKYKGRDLVLIGVRADADIAYKDNKIAVLEQQLAERDAEVAARKSMNYMGAKLARFCLSVSDYMPDDEARQTDATARAYLKESSGLKKALKEQGK